MSAMPVKQRVFWAAAAGLAALLAAFAASHYPVTDSDGVAFLPCVIEWTSGRGFVDPVSVDGSLSDPSGLNRFVHYPPYFQYLLAVALLFVPGVDGIYWGLYGLIVLVAGAWLAVAVLYGGRPSAWSGARWLGTAFGLLGMLTFLTGHLGRPEPPLLLALALGFAVDRVFRGGVRDLLTAVLLGLGAVSHPIGALLWAAGLGCVYAKRHHSLEALRRLGAVYAGAAGLALSVLAMSPHGLGETLLGIARHAKYAVILQHSSNLVFYACFDPKSWMFGPVFVLAGFLFLTDLYHHRSSIRAPKLFALFMIVLSSIVWRTALLSPLRLYNLFLFAPPVFGYFVHRLDGLGRRRAAVWALLGILALTGVGFARTTALFPLYLKEGMSLREARERFERVRDRARRDERLITHDVATTGWVLSDDFENILCVNDVGLSRERRAGALFILPEAFRGGSVPEPVYYGEFVLEENHFVSRPARIGPFRLGGRIPGHGFAVYRIPER